MAAETRSLKIEKSFPELEFERKKHNAILEAAGVLDIVRVLLPVGTQPFPLFVFSWQTKNPPLLVLSFTRALTSL